MRVRGKIHSSGKIIAGADGNICQRHSLKIRDTVDDFIDRPVASQNDQSTAAVFGQEFSGNSGSVASVSSQEPLVVYIPLF